jgi:hypothetical protein
MAKLKSTGRKQASHGNPNIREIGKTTRFKKDDPRINREGYKPPKNRKEILDLMDRIANEPVPAEAGKLLTKLELALNRILLNKQVSGPTWYIEYRYGKLPEKLDLTSGGKPLTWKEFITSKLADNGEDKKDTDPG